MQKNTKKASILLWSIFMSMIIMVIFLGASSKIYKILLENKEIKINIEINKEIENIIKEYSQTGFYLDSEINNSERIEFSKPDSRVYGVKLLEKIKIQFPLDSNINIKILEGGPVKFSLTGTNTNSGLIVNNSSIITGSGRLEIKGIGGYTKFKINSTEDFIPQYTIYKVLKKIGNKEVIKTKGIIKNF